MRPLPRLLSLAVALSFAACTLPEEADPPERPGYDENGRRDIAGLIPVDGVKAGLLYPVYDSKRDREGSGWTYADYGCVSDCSDIRAGFQDAKEHNIRDPKLCTGPTWGDLEGCVAFTQNLTGTMTELPPIRE